MKLFAIPAAVILLASCSQEPPETATEIDVTTDSAVEPQTELVEKSRLETVLDGLSDEHKARYQYRHPNATMDFFGIEPGMTVAEYLPGGGWYSKVLSPYLGKQGTLIGVDYSPAIWSQFPWANDEYIERRKVWREEFPGKVADWGGVDAANGIATNVADIKGQYSGQVDAALFIRALHNMSRFESEGQFLSEAMKSR